jgi:hypothetical protein
MSFTVEQILKGTALGPMQSVGQMQVIPVLGADDPTFAPPELEVSTQGYGTVLLRNVSDLPTIVPPGAGWVVEHKAQDHALGGASFLRPRQHKTVDTAMCIQQSQGGYIPTAKHAMAILPAVLRPIALSMRKVVGYSKLWDALTQLNVAYGLRSAGGSLAAFLRSFGRQLDEFVAELELVPRQIGAIVLVSGEVVGIERAPSAAYFAAVWSPLVRLCYGSLALAAGKVHTTPPVTRLPLQVTDHTLSPLERVRAALRRVEASEAALSLDVVESLGAIRLDRAEEDDEVLDSHVLRTVANEQWAGQVVTRLDPAGGEAVVFGSVTTRKVGPLAS